MNTNQVCPLGVLGASRIRFLVLLFMPPGCPRNPFWFHPLLDFLWLSSKYLVDIDILSIQGHQLRGVITVNQTESEDNYLWMIDNLKEMSNNMFSRYLLEVFTDPQRNGCSPVPVSRYVPITCILQPIMKSLFFDKFRHPKLSSKGEHMNIALSFYYNYNALTISYMQLTVKAQLSPPAFKYPSLLSPSLIKQKFEISPSLLSSLVK